MSKVSTSTCRPPTGTEYLQSLQDGREVWLYGERVTNVTAHPALKIRVPVIGSVVGESVRVIKRLIN